MTTKVAHRAAEGPKTARKKASNRFIVQPFLQGKVVPGDAAVTEPIIRISNNRKVAVS